MGNLWLYAAVTAQYAWGDTHASVASTRLGGQGIGRLDADILRRILGDSFPNPVIRGRVLPARFTH